MTTKELIMSDAVEPADVEVWIPTDTWLAGMIRRLRGLSTGEPLPPGLLESWRRHVAREIRRHTLAKARGRPAGPMPAYRRPGNSITPDDLVLDLLASEEGQFLVGVAAGMPALLAACGKATAEMQVQAWRARREHERQTRADTAELVRYLSAKSGGPAYCEDCRWPLYAPWKAACNGVTPARANAWRARLADTSRSVRVVRDLLAEIAEVGCALIRDTAPLGIWYADSMPPRGLVPDPPEPDEDDASTRHGGNTSDLKPEPRGGR
jgi:hypothetical protein